MDISINELIKIISDVAFAPDLDEDTELIKSGIIDSFDMISLISELAYRYNINIKVADIDPENFSSPKDILATIKRVEERENK